MDVLFVQWCGQPAPAEILFCPDRQKNCGYYSIPHILLRDQLRLLGIDLYPHEWFSSARRADALISIDLPSNRSDLLQLCEAKLKCGSIRVLIAMESPLARPEHLSRVEFRQWHHVFHYNNNLVQADKLIGYKLPSNLDFLGLAGPDFFHDKTRLIGMMGTNKPSKFSNPKVSPFVMPLRGYKFDLISAERWLRLEDGLRIRRRMAKDLSRLIPQQFRVFGGQWDGMPYAPHHRMFPPRRNKCAMGHVACNVLSIIKGFKYFFALENAIHDDGYLTEKLFNVLRAGVVPLYKPATNSSLFPPGCDLSELPFVDLRGISGGRQLLQVLAQIDERLYMVLRENGRKFLESTCSMAHRPEAYAADIASKLAERLRASL